LIDLIDEGEKEDGEVEKWDGIEVLNVNHPGIPAGR